eukprot:scaffold10451_cov121-Isochrysis_galbana.AAC.12
MTVGAPRRVRQCGQESIYYYYYFRHKRSVNCELTHARHAQAPPQSQRLHSAVVLYPGYSDWTMD